MCKNLYLWWHTFQLKYQRALMDGCLDEKIREHAIQELGYHSNKLNELHQEN